MTWLSVLSPLSLGKRTIGMPVLLAPMAGVTDQPFRKMVRRFGAGLVVSEMIASQAMIRHVRKTMQMIEPAGTDDILTVQIAGSDPEIMAQAARLNEDRGAQIIDINFGCPAKKIVGNLAGAALMRDEARAARILEEVVKAVSIPVTLKMRLGWNEDNLNAPRMAKIAQESGIQMITVHARTRQQFYKGKADWQKIRAVKEAVNLPVIANGDITDAQTLMQALELSGADGVMIGRASCGRPWFLKQMMDFVATGQVSLAPALPERYAILCEHFQLILDAYGIEAGLRIARKHIGWYSAGLPKASHYRAAINQTADLARAQTLIKDFFEQAMMYEQEKNLVEPVS
ncbi:MAG: tRNA dihydrouridine synthase DusB [Alphaproteobacteria bacterium]|nr:tRNA dihydrouridine synthase DusB [Alphaproteobacteria bacterium]